MRSRWWMTCVPACLPASSFVSRLSARMPINCRPKTTARLVRHNKLFLLSPCGLSTFHILCCLCTHAQVVDGLEIPELLLHPGDWIGACLSTLIYTEISCFICGRRRLLDCFVMTSYGLDYGNETSLFFGFHLKQGPSDFPTGRQHHPRTTTGRRATSRTVTSNRNAQTSPHHDRVTVCHRARVHFELMLGQA